MNLPKFIYESLPLLYFAMGQLSANLEYGKLSAALFYSACLIVHITRYKHRYG